MDAKSTDTVSHHGKFKYRAIDAMGKSQTGVIDADSEREAMRLLCGRHLTPTQLTPTQSVSGSGSRKIKASDVLAFTNGLCTLVESRVPIDRALRLLEGITESAVMRELTLELLREIKEGRSLAAAMEGYPRVFSKMYVNIVRAGEEGGILHELLPELAEFLETSAATRQTIVSAMIYPAVLLVTGIVSVLLLLVFVVPQFATMFEDAGTQIPPPRTVFAQSERLVTTVWFSYSGERCCCLHWLASARRRSFYSPAPRSLSVVFAAFWKAHTHARKRGVRSNPGLSSGRRNSTYPCAAGVARSRCQHAAISAACASRRRCSRRHRPWFCARKNPAVSNAIASARRRWGGVRAHGDYSG